MTTTEAVGSDADPDHVEAKQNCVRTVAFDDWRAKAQLCGEMDLASVDVLRAELAGHLDAGRHVLRIDATELTFLDSTIIGALVEASQRCRAGRGSLILAAVQPQVRRVLAIAGLDHLLLVDGADTQP